MKKRWICLLLALALLMSSSLSGCGKEGLETTETKTAGYAGTWAEGEIYWLYGGLILDITEKGRNMTIDATYTQAAPDSRVASFSVSVALTEIKDNSLTVEFEDDGWGNAGTLVLEFGESEINCEIKDTHYVGDEAFAIWGVTPGQYYLYRNDDAYEMLEYEIEEYYEWLEECEQYLEETTTYDTSIASGILAEAGLTEQQFRDVCAPLTSDYSLHYNFSATPEVYRIDRYHLAYGIQYYSEHAEETTVNDAIAKWNDICLDYKNGGKRYTASYGYGMYSKYHLYEKYGEVDAYLYDTVYAPKGADILLGSSNEIFNRMKEYPNEFIGVPYVLIGFGIEPNNNYVYTDSYYLKTEVTVYDLRDDVHNPNVISGNDYYLYVIFEGTYIDSDGDIGLMFSLISLEKCE